MRRQIPSNSALLAFEAAARHGSFARAADELALTEGAISRQIARLETWACKNFCVNGHLAGNCRASRSDDDRSKESRT